jgi:chromosome segregation ATPase
MGPEFRGGSVSHHPEGTMFLSCYYAETEAMSELGEKVAETIHEHEHGHESGLGSIIALLVALAATFVALASVKDRNITLRMDQAQAKSVDTWNYYQAKSTKQNLAEATLDELSALKGAAPAAAGPELEKRITDYEKQVKRYEHEKGEVKEEAEGYEHKYESLNEQHDLFDLSDAAMSVAIALLGVTALTKKKWLLGVAAVFLATGVFFGFAGFMNWSIHPESAIKWLA